jgi:hypothetical protein
MAPSASCAAPTRIEFGCEWTSKALAEAQIVEGCAREDFAPQCDSDDVAARKGRAARNSRRAIFARVKNGVECSLTYVIFPFLRCPVLGCAPCDTGKGSFSAIFLREAEFVRECVNSRLFVFARHASVQYLGEPSLARYSPVRPICSQPSGATCVTIVGVTLTPCCWSSTNAACR